MGSTLEAVATFLFKYPPRLFERGTLGLAPVFPPVVVALLGAGLVAFLFFTVRRIRTPRSGRDRLLLGALRGATCLVLLGCLMRPVLLVSSSVPQRNVLGILLDDSRSMRLADVGGSPRLEAVQRVFGDSAGSVVSRLGERFVLRFFRFAADAAPVAGAGALRASGTRTDVATALDAARQELAGVPLAGLVLVSDGADNGGNDLTAPLLALTSRRIPVYTVGVGQERFARDLAIERIGLPASALAGAGVLAEVALRVRGLASRSVTVTAEDEGRIVAEREVALPASGDLVRTRLRLPPMAEGAHRLTVRVRPVEGEVVTENNEARTVLRIRPGPERILYLEGEPRPEFAMLRRAVAPDSALQLVALLRSAKGKFLRLGVRDSLELVGGFPTRREDLFRFRALILGNIEAAFFTGDQLRMMADFVSRRGGGLVALGGRNALAEGGYAGTPLAEVLPVSLDAKPAAPREAPVTLTARITPAGLVHPALQLGATEQAAHRWDSLPALTAVNRLGALKPGATVLLAGRPAAKDAPEVPLLAFQRFGRGTAAVVGAQDTWTWQMDSAMSVEDQTHEAFWRQLLRWSLDAVPDRVDLVAVPARVGPGEPVVLHARVADEAWLESNDAIVSARAIAPSGRTLDVPMAWTLREDGEYEGRFTAEEEGLYRLEASARRGRDTVSATPAALLVDDFGADVEQAELRTPLLRRIAGETGGRYYPLADATRLVEDAAYTESGITVRESRDLWDMPAVFFLLVLLLGLEWGYRRWLGLA